MIPKVLKSNKTPKLWNQYYSPSMRTDLPDLIFGQYWWSIKCVVRTFKKWFLGYTAKHDYTVRYINEILTLCFKFAEKYKLKIISPRVRRFLVHCVYKVVKVKDLITFHYAGFFSSNRKQCSLIRFMIKLNHFGGKQTLRSTVFLMILNLLYLFFCYWNLCWHISAPLVQNKLCQHARKLCQHAT